MILYVPLGNNIKNWDSATCNSKTFFLMVIIFSLTEILVILIVDIRTCKLVWMLLLPDHPISPCCYRSSRGPCWGDNRVEPYFVPFLFPFKFKVISASIPSIRSFLPGLLKQEKHWCLLLIKSFLLDHLGLGRWYDSLGQSKWFILSSHLKLYHIVVYLWFWR
jgi:hypothetical protein